MLGVITSIAQAMRLRKKLPHEVPPGLSVENQFSTDILEPYDLYEGIILRMQLEEITPVQPSYKVQITEDDFFTDMPEPYDFYEGIVFRMQLEEIMSAQPDYEDKTGGKDDSSIDTLDPYDFFEGVLLRKQLEDLRKQREDSHKRWQDERKQREDEHKRWLDLHKQLEDSRRQLEDSRKEREDSSKRQGDSIKRQEDLRRQLEDSCRQLEDVELVHPDRKGKGREVFKSDAEIARDLQQEEVQHQSTLALDEQIARSLAMTMEADMEAIARITLQDTISSKDRELAMLLHEHEEQILSLKNSTPQSLEKEAAIVSYQKNLDRVAMAKTFQSHHKQEPPRIDHRIPTAESSRTAMKRKPLLPLVSVTPSIVPDQRECTACRDDVPVFDLANLPCGHDYCKACLSRLFTNAIDDENEFPPRCCMTTIIQDYISMFLDSTIATRFDAKKEEYGTTNRTYCQNSKCSTFIPRSRIVNDVGRCSKCGQGTCTVCKKANHGGSECPDDPTLLSTIELAEKQHWQRCSKCAAIVELNTGCHHITCRCGYQFCYTCGSKWHTCSCHEGTVPQLLQRAGSVGR